MALISSISEGLHDLEDGPDLYNRKLVIAGDEDILISHTIADDDLILVNLVVGGNDDGEFTLFIDSVEKLRVRNSWTNRSPSLDLGLQTVNIGDLVEVKVLSEAKSKTQFFEARLTSKKKI